MTIEEFENIAMSAFGELPDALKANLNLGFTIIPEPKMDRERISYILGEYYVDPMMGRGIRLFYGSFMATMGHLPPNLLAREIIKTVKHEIRHHVELSAGVDYLGDEDRRKIARIKRRFGLINDEIIEKAIKTKIINSVLVVVLLLFLILFLLWKFQ